MRHSASGAPHFLARFLRASVVNAGDGAHEHPTQAMLDCFTIREKKGKIAGLNVTILGDILYSRVARSNIWALTKLGARVTLCGPATLVPKVFERMGCRVTYNVDEAIEEADIINLLRIQHERQRKTMFPSIGEYSSLFGLTKARLARTKPEALIMHPGPINRGVEIDSEIADSSRSVILDQVTNGLAVRMAVLFLINGGKGAAGSGGVRRSSSRTRRRAQMNHRRPGSAKVRRGEGKTHDFGMTRQDGVNAALQMAKALAVNDAHLQQSPFLTGREPFGHQLAHVARTEGVQIQDAIHGQFDRSVVGWKFRAHGAAVLRRLKPGRAVWEGRCWRAGPVPPANGASRPVRRAAAFA